MPRYRIIMERVVTSSAERTVWGRTEDDAREKVEGWIDDGKVYGWEVEDTDIQITDVEEVES